MSSVLCFYHAPCNDGATSAAVLRHRLRLTDPDAVVGLIPLSYTVGWSDPLGEEYLERLKHDEEPVAEIYIVDISISKAKHAQILEYLREHGRIGDAPPRTICIDHHKTALDKVEELQEFCDETDIRIGPGLSGASLVWEYFDRRHGDREAPDIVRYVADQDIWEWKLPDSKEINAALNTLDGYAETFVEELEWSLQQPEDWKETRTREGKAIISAIDAQLQKAFSRVHDVVAPDGVEYRVVNGTDNSSELGNLLCEESEHHPNVIAMIYSVQRDWSVKCSVRSVDGGKTNARQVAERFEGGGHDNASGCRFESMDAFRAAVDELTGQHP